MSDNFNELESAVLNWLKQTYQHARLSAQVDAARFLKRDWTKVGFWVHLKVPADLEPIDLNDFDGNWPIYGPDLRSEDIHLGGGTLIWGTDGYINCIEMFAFGDFFSEQVTDFEFL